MAISNLVATNVVNFIDYSLVIVVIMTIWYGVKFFMIEGPSKEERQAEREKQGTAIRDWFKDKKEKAKTEAERKKEERQTSAEKKKREHLLNPALGFIVLAEQAAEKLRDDELKTKTAAAVNSAKSQMQTIERNLKSSKRVLRAARLAEKDPQLQEFFLKLYETNQVALKMYEDGIEKAIPSAADRDWDIKVQQFRQSINDFRGFCGLLIITIRKFIHDSNTEFTVPSAPRRKISPPGGSS